MPSNATTERPIGLGRRGPRVAKMPRGWVSKGGVKTSCGGFAPPSQYSRIRCEKPAMRLQALGVVGKHADRADGRGIRLAAVARAIGDAAPWGADDADRAQGEILRHDGRPSSVRGTPAIAHGREVASALFLLCHVLLCQGRRRPATRGFLARAKTSRGPPACAGRDTEGPSASQSLAIAGTGDRGDWRSRGLAIAGTGDRGPDSHPWRRLASTISLQTRSGVIHWSGLL